MYMLCAFADYTEKTAIAANAPENRKMLGFWLALEQAYLHFLFVLLYEPEKDVSTVISCLAKAVQQMNDVMTPQCKELIHISYMAEGYLGDVHTLSVADRQDMAERVQASYEKFVKTEECKNLDITQSFRVVLEKLYQDCEGVWNRHTNVGNILMSEQWATLYHLDDKLDDKV